MKGLPHPLPQDDSNLAEIQEVVNVENYNELFDNAL